MTHDIALAYAPDPPEVIVLFECEECGGEYPSRLAADRCCED